MGRETPRFSIVIPTYRRPHQLRECLRSVAALDYPRERFEVIVVDDGGDVSLGPVLAPFEAELDVVFIRQVNSGPAHARNAAADRARGDLLAFTDDDCRVERGWLRQLAGVLAADPHCLVGGRTVNVAPPICSAVSQLILDVVYNHYNADPANARFVASNNLALSVRGFREIGGFDGSFRCAEDRDLCDRWRHGGRRIVYHPAAGVRHCHALDIRSFCRQHFEYGRGAERFNRLRAARGSGSMLAEMRFHRDVRNWVAYPLSRVPPRRMPSVAALLALWQASYLAGFLWETMRGRRAGVRDDAFSPA